jgi:hypothetical protein
MQTQLLDFYNKNLEKLDTDWKAHCFEKYKGKAIGDVYFSSTAFWKFVKERFEDDVRVRRKAS